MHDRIRFLLSRFFLALAAILIGFWLFSFVDARLFDARTMRLGNEARQEAGGASRAVAARREARASGVVGRIDVPRLALSAPVGEGTTGRVLRRGAGHVAGTSFPGEPGNVGIAGHRDQHFRKLKDIRAGDLIHVRTPDGRFTYRVDSILIVRPQRGDLLHPTPDPSLTLVTCYPFYYVGPAPKRFVVRARQVPVSVADATRRGQPS